MVVDLTVRARQVHLDALDGIVAAIECAGPFEMDDAAADADEVVDDGEIAVGRLDVAGAARIEARRRGGIADQDRGQRPEPDPGGGHFFFADSSLNTSSMNMSVVQAPLVEP